jgi:hypothetical protein
VTNPYSPPQAKVGDPSPRRLTLLDALLLGTPALLYAAHGLLLMGVIVYAHLDTEVRREPMLFEVLSRPLIMMQPICSLFASAMLFLRRRLALIGALGLPILVTAYWLRYATNFPTLHLSVTGSLGFCILLLAVLRKLK